MPLSRVLVSCLLLFHITASCIDAIPSSRELGADRFVAARGRNPVSRAVGPALDNVVRSATPIERRLFETTRPLSAISSPYRRLGIQQRWDMFSRPPIYNQYVRLTYYLALPAEPRITELVFPLGREDEIRLTHDYQDKAVMSAFETFFRTNAERQDVPSPRPLLPLIHHFRTRYERRHAADAPIVRTELWYGRAPIPQPGERASERASEARRTVLNAYYRGPVAPPNTRFELPHVGSQEQEADIIWVLAAVDESRRP